MDRRLLLKGAAAASAAFLVNQGPLAAAAGQPASDHYVPADKNLDPEWVKTLFARGNRKIYHGKELETIGMPCGGICAGQLYVRGDGTLAKWWIANNAYKTSVPGPDHVISTPLGEHQSGYRTYRAASHIDQGFAIRVKLDGAEPLVRTLDRDEFDDIRFFGEYPIATIEYRNRHELELPIDVQLEAFSPFIPLNARDSGQPATVLRFTVRNRASEAMDVSVAGWLQNAVCLDWENRSRAYSRNLVMQHAGLTSVQMDLQLPVPKPSRAHRVVMFEDFEQGTYQNWRVEGEAFGEKPTQGTPPNLKLISGWKGQYFANTLGNRGDAPQGRLISKAFQISEPYVAFLIGSGNYRDRTCLNLVVKGRVVRTASGKGDPQMEFRWWDVEDLIGQKAHLEIVDHESGPWGHLTVDHIYFTNRPPEGSPSPRHHPQFGNMALSALDSQASATANWESKAAFLADLTQDGKLDDQPVAKSPLGEKLCGAIASSFRLKAGEERDVTFLLTWYFPNRQQDNRFVAPGAPSGTGRRVGNMYANWYNSSLDVARYLAENFKRLDRQTHLFRDTYFDTTLPYWFAQRIAMQASTLATETCQWWANGRFWGFEGVGCCPGTCNHVWHYEQTMARLFPELQRSVLSMQTFDPEVGFVAESGMIRFRGEGWKYRELWRGGDGPEWAADGQAANILMALREHQLSVDDTFLHNHWAYIRGSLEFLIEQDVNADGLIEGRQPSTYDAFFFSANTMVGSLYLAALRAGQVMARVVGETAFSQKCHRLYQSGRQLTVERLFNGEYFIQEVDLQKHPKWQYAEGCLSDQLIGQTWAHHLDLGYLYPKQQVLLALESIWKYNWTPDVGLQTRKFRPGMQLADPGEAGLMLCTWPKRPYAGSQSVRYRDKVWTGIEFQVAAEMIYEGKLTEGLALVRAVHDRYDGTKHNPWNLIECGDHYSRAMASWGCLLAVTGFVFDASEGKIGFAPRLTPENFKAFFTAAEGWGSLVQKRSADRQTNRIELKWGRLGLKMLRLELPVGAKLQAATVSVAGRQIVVKARQEDPRVTIVLDEHVALAQDEAIEVDMTFFRADE